nr:lachesin-like [Procambarus clarkii]
MASFLTVTICSAALPNDIHSGGGMKAEPQFGDSIENVTVAAGREARLSCIVDNLGDYRVGWLKVDSQTILSLQKRVVTHNSRISVTHDEHRTWNLHIRHVQETDNGCYMCQINTPVMKNQVGCIKVHVPPDIINDLTSSDTTINEGDTVHLRCVAEGYPSPEIKWKREDGRDIVIKSSGRDPPKTLESVPGTNLTLENVSRRQMGAYLCIASNKVPPSVSKRIIVNVNFSPVVKADNQLIGSPLETNVEIQCHVEAFPMAVNYWERDNGEIILNGRKYELEEVIDSYRVTMKLVIKNFTKDDAGQYKCISTNSLGKAETSIRLYEIEVPTPRSTTEHQYHLYATTPHSKSVNSLDLRRREGGQSRHLDGVSAAGGTDGATAGLGVDFDKEQSRQRQRQRLEFGGDGRTDNGGYLGSKFGPPGEGHDDHGNGGSATTQTRGCWFESYLVAVWTLAQVLVARDVLERLL